MLGAGWWVIGGGWWVVCRACWVVGDRWWVVGGWWFVMGGGWVRIRSTAMVTIGGQCVLLQNSHRKKVFTFFLNSQNYCMNHIF